jgi:FkbM family methyltransferase
VATQPPQQDEAQRFHAFFDNSSEGFFTELGVSHPTKGSATWALEAAGWVGVLIEPQPDVAAFLVTARSAKVFPVACDAPDRAGRPLPLRVAGPLSSIGVGPSSATAASNYVIMVPTRTLDNILQEAEAPMPLDLLVLDTGGRELDALLGFDFKRWRPRLIAIADPIIDLQRHRFLRESGYRLICRVGRRGWYVPAGSPAAARRERWPILRDYYLKLPFRMAWHALRRLNARIMASAD